MAGPLPAAPCPAGQPAKPGARSRERGGSGWERNQVGAITSPWCPKRWTSRASLAL